MAKLSPLMVVPPLVFAGFGVLFYIGLGHGDESRRLDSMFDGKPAPEMTEVALAGYPGVTQADLASGEVTIVNFWASWCAPCRVEHPRLLEMQAEGLRLIGVNIRDTEANALKYLSDHGNPFEAVPFDPSGRTGIEWGVTGQPETFILDGDGTVVFKFVGPLVGSDYEQRFVPALEAAQAKVAEAS